MATQTVQVQGIPGEVGAVIHVFPEGSDTEDDNAAATEATNRLGAYTAAFTDLPAGFKRFELRDSGNQLLSVQYGQTTADDGLTFLGCESPLSQLAASLLKRSVAGEVENNADEHSLATVILALLEGSRTGTTWTIKKTDGTTKASKTLTLDASAEPVVGVD